MPVRRLKSLAEAEESVWMARDDERLIATIREVWRLADRMCPPRFPPGVYRHRSIEAANAQTAAWARAIEDAGSSASR